MIETRFEMFADIIAWIFFITSFPFFCSSYYRLTTQEETAMDRASINKTFIYSVLSASWLTSGWLL